MYVERRFVYWMQIAVLRRRCFEQPENLRGADISNILYLGYPSFLLTDIEMHGGRSGTVPGSPCDR